jgi:[CysO sulfur-carrier protein]-S-L-cysteine hydrolase
MTDHALREFPNECCGIILEKNKTVTNVLPMKSLHPSTDTYFMDPVQQTEVFSEMQQRGESLFGIYHSHPEGPLQPSGMDLQLAFHPGAIYFIISLENRNSPEIGAFILEGGQFKQVYVEFV